MRIETKLSECRKESKQRKFLDNFRRTGILSDAADAAGVSRQTVYFWKKTSPSFVLLMKDAQQESECTGLGYLHAAIGVLAQSGDADMQNYIRTRYGPRALKKVMEGKKLTYRGVMA